MNHAYRLIWSELSASPVAVPETAAGRGKSRGRRLARGLVGVSALGALVWGAQAQNLPPTQLPGQAQVSAGTVSMTRASNALVVSQTSDKAVLNWSSFDIGRDASVSFVQPGASSTALNRVQGGMASQIEGRLSANGQVFLVNPSGIVFGRGAQVNVAGLVASSLDWATEDFLADRWRFAGPSTAAAVVNQGRVQADGGVIALVAPRVSNSGSLQADGGQVVLAAGQKVAFKVSGSGLLQVTVDQGAVDALVENKGLIQADGGSVLLTAKGANALLSGVVNNEGVVRAHTLQEREGRIVLLGDMDQGAVQVGGQLDASAPQGGKGGFIETSAAQVFVAPDARVSTLAAQGQHGTWLIDPVDFNIATGGNITGAQLGTQLEGGNITILNSSGNTGTAGNVNVQEAVSWNAATTLTLDAQGSVNLNADLSAASGHLAINAAAGGLSGSGAMSFGGSQQTVTVNQGGNSIYSGVISGTGTSLSKTGAGTLTLSGASSYSGGTTVGAGTLQAGASSSGAVTTGPLGTAGVTVAGSATLDLAGQSLANPLNLSGQGVGAAGALINSSANGATASGAVTLAADTTVGTTGAGALSLGGTVNGAYALSVKSQGDVAFNAAVGGTAPLASFTTDAGGRTLLGANVTTTGTQTYNDDVVASAAITLQALGVVVPASAKWTTGLPVGNFAISDGSSPGSEAVQYAFDGNVWTKYLNFKGPGSDVLMDLGAARVVSQVSLTSGPDDCCLDRDPTSYTLYGSNTAFVAGNTGTPGSLPNAVKLGSGVLAPPDARRADYTDASLVFDNSTAYRYYRLVFDTVRSSPNLVQISEIGLSRAASVDTSTAALNFKAGLSGTAALTLQSAGSLSAKTIQAAGALTLQHDGVGTVQGVISDGASPLSLVKAGKGTLSLLGANTYTGGTALNAGTLGIYTNTALGTGAMTVGTAALKIGRAVTQLDNALVLNGTASLAFDRDVDYLVVGGGGAGASGGGGAGGFLSGTTALTDASYAVTVGAGGTSAGSSGTASVAFGQTAGGGGGGGGGASPGQSGASGGGGGYDGQYVAQATGIAGQGFSGGVSNRTAYGAGAGGGGAGGAGSNASVAPDSFGRGGDGGLGKASDITGEVKYYAGGGGGGANTPTSGTPGGLGALVLVAQARRAIGSRASMLLPTPARVAAVQSRRVRLRAGGLPVSLWPATKGLQQARGAPWPPAQAQPRVTPFTPSPVAAHWRSIRPISRWPGPSVALALCRSMPPAVWSSSAQPTPTAAAPRCPVARSLVVPTAVPGRLLAAGRSQWAPALFCGLTGAAWSTTWC